MKKIGTLVALAVVSATSALSSTAMAAPLLAVDFGRNLGNDPGTPSFVQAGFNGVAGNFPLGPNSPPPSLAAVVGAFTVTVTGDPYQGSDYSRVGFEDTAAAASGIDPSIRNLYQDAMINNLDLDDGSGLNLSIQGITPNTLYSLKFWSYNAENTIYATPTSFGPRAGSNTSGTSGSIVQFASPLPTMLDDYSTTILVSSTTNTLDIHAASTANYGGTRMNGFELSVVPEPCTLALAVVGCIWAAARCRRLIGLPR
jgi:hypothetical protein